MQINEKIFREYDVRGVAASDLSDANIDKLSRAIGTFIRKKGGKTIAVGRDCRASSPRINATLCKGLMSTGLNIIDVGLVPTPGLYFAVIELKTDGGIMITGSHNPPEHNGFKICVGPSTIHGEDIQEIKKILLKGDFATGQGNIQAHDIKERYISYIVDGIAKPIKYKIVVDSGNGMAGIIAPELYRRLGCDVIDLYSELDGTFPNHHPDPTVPHNLETLIKTVKEKKAFVGIAFDGDADRIGVIDESGKLIFGDELLVLYARQILKKHPGAKVISEVKASHRLFQDIESHGGTPVLWKTGHSLIKAKMKETGALLAGEMSGHMFFKDRYFGYDDAIYAGARLLEILSESKQTPLKMLADLPPTFSTPEIRVDCSDDIKFDVVQKARIQLEKHGYRVNGIDGARIEFDDGWGLVRASNTQPVLVYRFEATSEKRLNEIRRLVESTVTSLLSR